MTFDLRRGCSELLPLLTVYVYLLSKLIIGATVIFYTSYMLQYCSQGPTRGCSGGPLFVSAISPSLHPHLATSDLPCYCSKNSILTFFQNHLTGYLLIASYIAHNNRYPLLKSLCISGYELKKMQMNMNFQGKTVSSTHKNSINHDNRPLEVGRCSFNINNQMDVKR